jgi:hypothetical protein
MKLSSSEMFGRGKHEATEEEARADEATVDDTTAPGAGYGGEPTMARPTFTPAEDGTVDDGAAPVRGEVVDDAPVTAADGDLVTDEPVRRSRMAYDRPTATDEPGADEPGAYEEPEASGRSAAYDEPAEYDRSVTSYEEPGYNEPGYNEPAGQPVSDMTDPAEDRYPALDADEPTAPTGVTEPATPAAGVPAPRQAVGTPTGQPSSALSAGPMADLDQPLLTDTEFQTQWQRVQAGFVDDPRTAVSEAAGLVEQAGDALATALRERQNRLRALWDNGTGRGNGEAVAAGGTGDTEELRLMMRRYRGLFDQLSHL